MTKQRSTVHHKTKIPAFKSWCFEGSPSIISGQPCGVPQHPESRQNADPKCSKSKSLQFYWRVFVFSKAADETFHWSPSSAAPACLSRCSEFLTSAAVLRLCPLHIKQWAHCLRFSFCLFCCMMRAFKSCLSGWDKPSKWWVIKIFQTFSPLYYSKRPLKQRGVLFTDADVVDDFTSSKSEMTCKYNFECLYNYYNFTQ